MVKFKKDNKKEFISTDCEHLFDVAHKILEGNLKILEESKVDLILEKNKLSKKAVEKNIDKNTQKWIVDRLWEFDTALGAMNDEENELKIIKKAYDQLYNEKCVRKIKKKGK